MDWIWSLFSFLALSIFLIKSFKCRRSKRLPPGPTGLPILGNLHMLGHQPHRDLQTLAKKYGSIMYLRLGLIPTIVVSSPQAAELFLKTYDIVFASRPSHQAAMHMSYGQKNISFSPYGPYWRSIRKMCTLELLSNVKINSFKELRKEELGNLIRQIRQVAATSSRAVVDLSAEVSAFAADLTCRMVFGKKYIDKDIDERGFKAVIQEAMEIAATFNLSDYIPPIAKLDLQGVAKRSKAISRVFDEFFEKIIDEHVQSQDQNKTKDFVDFMLDVMGSEQADYPIERENIKAVILDMLAGATDTSSTAIEWTLSELMKHPRTLNKVQKELENVVGMNRMVEESDIDSLEYLYLVVKETMRLHPVAPLLLPHASMEDCIVNEFHIPKNSRILINMWAIGRDQDAWIDAEKFWPERFVGSNIDVRGRDFQLLPFGSGRRGCPGMQLGLTIVRLVVAQLVHCFDWDLPDGKMPSELDMTEKFSLVTPRANNLCAIPSFRLKI